MFIILLEFGMQSRSGYHSVQMLLSSLVNHTTTRKVLFLYISVLIKKKKNVHDPCPYDYGYSSEVPQYPQQMFTWRKKKTLLLNRWKSALYGAMYSKAHASMKLQGLGNCQSWHTSCKLIYMQSEGVCTYGSWYMSSISQIKVRWPRVVDAYTDVLGDGHL